MTIVADEVHDVHLVVDADDIWEQDTDDFLLDPPPKVAPLLEDFQ